MTQPGEVRVRRALLSVSDKRGIADFARGLAGLGVEIVSTGGTARELAEAGLEVRPIEDFTGFPEIMGGRVKALHPKLYAGVLALRDDPSHMAALNTELCALPKRSVQPRSLFGLSCSGVNALNAVVFGWAVRVQRMLSQS